MQFQGPRPACLAIDKLADDIGNPVIEIINGLNLSEEEKAEARKKIEDVLIETFTDPEKTVYSVRLYIYELNGVYA